MLVVVTTMSACIHVYSIGYMSENYKSRFDKKFSSYKHTEKAKEWLSNNLWRIKSVFLNISLRDYIFEPFEHF